MSCPATQRTFAKDVHQLRKTIDASTGGQASIIAVDELTVKVCLRPKSGLNAHAEFLLTIKCSSMYPMECPDVTFDSPIFHPNINPDYGSVCVSLLSYWRSCYNLLDLEDDEAIGACINTTDAELRESTIEGAYAPSDTTSVTANIQRLSMLRAVSASRHHKRTKKEKMKSKLILLGLPMKRTKTCLHLPRRQLTGRLAINAHLHSPWKWSIRRTRWSIRFAPQQNVDLSMTGIQIPPWRASSSRMMSDICLFCAKNKGMKNLVLLDPMALSPLSPLLNLMHYCEVPRPRLTGILWMTPLEALSPFYHVPIPVNEEEQENVHGRCEGDSDVYPTPLCLRFIAITALITNWVAWLSRMESYAALGMSRFYPTLIIAPVAACMLQPFSLGCGQAPLMDLWPMWLLRRLLSLSLRLSRLRFPFFHRSHSHLRYLFPFSDLDEI
ncbi:hypothetical protein TcWFU_009318 [Taenia crassiceps]|uniref:UBC core domain-containing protein n=1 Tax=Taenia crassiceps TaxID=6207 RepID=A0ABR4QU58_9CEST